MRVRPARRAHMRIYETLRTAHLERAQALAPATIVYRTRRYDFDEDVARGLDLVQAGPWRTALVVARSGVVVLEINEPLMLSSIRRTALAVLAARVSGAVRGRRVRVVTYAIGNDSPFRAAPRSLKARVRLRLDRVLVVFVARRVDRIAYGTSAAEELYRTLLGRRLRRARRVLVPALPAPLVEPDVVKDPDRVVFLGAFDERKGLTQILEAWPEVRARRPATRLTLIGKGVLEDLARALAATDDSVELVVDPPRAEIAGRLASASLLLLLSQPHPGWREQVGLPIVEGLAHGCVVLATTETGLASWLEAHGHGVLDPAARASEIADAVVDLLDRARPARSVLADLPPVDGRLAADDWLFAPELPDVPA